MAKNNNSLTTEQKIELMTLATKIDIEFSKSTPSLEQVIKNYKQMIKEITATSVDTSEVKELLSLKLDSKGLPSKKKY